MLSKSLGCSRRFNALHDVEPGIAEFAQLLFAMLIPHVDDFGRITGDPLSIKLAVLPASGRPLADFVTALHALHTVELITVYYAKNDIWLQVSKFDDHQTGLHKRTASLVPPIPKDDSGKFPEIPGNSWSRARAEENRTEEKGTEGKGTEEEISTVASRRNSLRSGHDREPKDNMRVITKIAHTVIAAEPKAGFADLKEAARMACAKAHIAYDAETVGAALESALAQRRVS